MDISETYIKMCKKAGEIQDPPTIRGDIKTGDFVANARSGKVTVCSGKYPVSSKLIWLPRQDQLQEMIFGVGQYGARQIAKALWDSCKENGSLIPREELGIPRIGTVDTKWSMEQLWLAFVMSQKYGKIWSDEDWI